MFMLRVQTLHSSQVSPNGIKNEQLEIEIDFIQFGMIRKVRCSFPSFQRHTHFNSFHTITVNMTRDEIVERIPIKYLVNRYAYYFKTETKKYFFAWHFASLFPGYFSSSSEIVVQCSVFSGHVAQIKNQTSYKIVNEERTEIIHMGFAITKININLFRVDK